MYCFRVMLFWVLWTLLTIMGGLLAPFMLPSRVACLWLARLWNRSTLWLARALLGMRLRFEGEWHTGPAIYASKHQSALETFALWLQLDNPAFVLKRELLRIPIFGWFLARSGPIAIDRSAGASAVDQIAEQGAARLAEGRSIVIFPEGTRRPVDAPPAYKPGGVWALYQLAAPLVPVALNTGALWPKKGQKRAGTAIIKALEPLGEGLGKETMLTELQTRIETAVAALPKDVVGG